VLIATVAAASVFAQEKAKPTRDECAAQLSRALDEMAEAGFSGSVLVAIGDDVLLDRGCGLGDRAHGKLNRSDTIFDIGSITKQFTATAILKLQEQKKLSVKDTLERFFEQVPANKRGIQLHDLLTHTSGLPNDVGVGSATTQRDELVRKALAAPMKSKPGAEFVYNNVGYMLLGAVVEIASGERYENYVRAHLFEPAGLKSSGFLRTDGIDTERTACGYDGKVAYGPAELGWYSWGLRGCGGALSTTGDLLRWSKTLQSDVVLSKASREQLFKPFLLDYAYGWWVRENPVHDKVITHGGTTRGFEASFTHYLADDLRVIVLCNDRGRSDAAASRLASIAAGRQAVEATVTLPSAQLDSLAGDYELSQGGNLTVRVDGDALVLEPSTEAVTALVAGGAKLDKNRELEKRAERVSDALATADARAAHELLSTQWPGWSDQMIKVWATWSDERGKLTEQRVLGSCGNASTLVQLVHERRTVVWTLSWKDGVLNGWSIDGGLPEAARYRPRSATEFAYSDATSHPPEEYVLTFERASSGAGRSFALNGRMLHLKARRGR